MIKLIVLIAALTHPSVVVHPERDREGVKTGYMVISGDPEGVARVVRNYSIQRWTSGRLTVAQVLVIMKRSGCPVWKLRAVDEVGPLNKLEHARKFRDTLRWSQHQGVQIEMRPEAPQHLVPKHHALSLDVPSDRLNDQSPELGQRSRRIRNEKD